MKRNWHCKCLLLTGLLLLSLLVNVWCRVRIFRQYLLHYEVKIFKKNYFFCIKISFILFQFDSFLSSIPDLPACHSGMLSLFTVLTVILYILYILECYYSTTRIILVSYFLFTNNSPRKQTILFVCISLWTEKKTNSILSSFWE